MSVAYRPVQWNRNKWLYDATLVAAVAIYIVMFLRVAPLWTDPARAVELPILRMRAFGTCAFFMLSLILCIGPLARLDVRFLPLLYNRRHFGVLTTLVALTHASFVLDWYYAFSSIDPYVALLSANNNFGHLRGFPFEMFGIVALLVLLLLAATSHDFWLSFLTPPVWKALHMSIYPAYAAIVAHIALGALQDKTNILFGSCVGIAVAAVCALHLSAARRDAQDDKAFAVGTRDSPSWLPVGAVSDIANGRAKIVVLPSGERVAVFRYAGKLSAVTNACAHQNGPLGEGRIVGGAITCPWHGFQFKPEDGCAPAPFTDKIATYNLRLEGAQIFLDPIANAPGTRVEPVLIPVSLEASS